MIFEIFFSKNRQKKIFFLSARKSYQKFLRAQNLFWAFFNAFSATKKFWRKKFCHWKGTEQKNSIFFCQKSDFFRAQAVQARVRLKKVFFLEVDNVSFSQSKFFLDTTYIRGVMSIGRFGGGNLLGVLKSGPHVITCK